jgi:hypothetical protein
VSGGGEAGFGSHRAEFRLEGIRAPETQAAAFSGSAPLFARSLRLQRYRGFTLRFEIRTQDARLNVA